MENILNVKNLNVVLNKQLILKNISFQAKNDDMVAIIGPNGAGKTVLFRTLLGFLPYTGIIEWQKGLKIGYVPQKLSLEADLPLTTLEFLKFKEKNEEEIKRVLKTVGFAKDYPHKSHLKNHVLERKIGVLSGGEVQRILIAWALLGHPDVLLFDEPTTGIDIGAEETIYNLLARLKEKENLTIFLISHELQIVYKYATNVICLNKENICFGPPQQVLNEDTLHKLFGGEIGVYKHQHNHE